MFERLKSMRVFTAIIIVGGLIIIFGTIFGPISAQTVGGKDWVEAFRNGARGDYSNVVTPYWSLFLSFLPAQLSEPFGYIVWITIGSILVIVTTNYFKSPLLAVVLSYQMCWVLYYGQIDPFILFGIGLGHYSVTKKKPLINGIAIALVTIKPQIGFLLAIYFFFSSTSKLKTAFVFIAIILLSLAIWPGWPKRLIFDQYLSFLDRPANIWTNTSLGLPLWISFILSAIALMSPMDINRKIPLLLSTTLLISPYSTIYSQLSLIVVGLPIAFSVFGFLPWLVAIFSSPFGFWQWAFIYPISVIVYLYYDAYRLGNLVDIKQWRISRISSTISSYSSVHTEKSSAE